MDTKVKYFKSRRTKDRGFIKKIVDRLKEAGFNTTHRYVNYVLDNQRGTRFSPLAEEIVTTATIIDEEETKLEEAVKERLRQRANRSNNVGLWDDHQLSA